MTTARVNDPRAFHEFLGAKLSNGGSGLTLEEALDLWEYENSSEEAKEETLQAIQRGLEDMYAGRTKPAADALRDLCRKHGIAEPR